MYTQTSVCECSIIDLKNYFRVLRPKHDSMGEEETSVQGKLPELTDGPIFCIDPIGLSAVSVIASGSG